MSSALRQARYPKGVALPAHPIDATASSERSLIASIAAHTSWANTTNRTARTAPARAGLDAKFLAEAGGDPERAASLRRAHFKRLALASARARRNKAVRDA